MSEKNPENDKSSAEFSKQKRNVLKGILASGGILSADAMVKDKWTTPVIDSVMLPAHAVQTAGGGDEGEGEQSISYFDVISGGAADKTAFLKNRAGAKSFAEKVLDKVIPQANANHRINQFDQLYICVTVTGTAFVVNITRDAGSEGIFNYGTSGTVGIKSIISGVTNQCVIRGTTANDTGVLVENPNDSNATVTLTDEAGDADPIVAIINRANCIPFMGSCPPMEEEEP